MAKFIFVVRIEADSPAQACVKALQLQQQQDPEFKGSKVVILDAKHNVHTGEFDEHKVFEVTNNLNKILIPHVEGV